MNRTLALLLALATASIPALAQDNNRPNGQSGDRQSRRSENRRPEGQGGPGGPVNNEGGRPRMASPLIETLDANHDGIIDASEIQNASAALMRLDKNGDGKMTLYELRTRRPEGGRGSGGRAIKVDLATHRKVGRVIVQKVVPNVPNSNK